jgi:hypothetical protein
MTFYGPIKGDPRQILKLPDSVQGKESETLRNSVNIYLLKDESIDLRTAAARLLSELALRDEPWIASENIERYDFSSHCIYLKKIVPQPVKNVPLGGTPFVVMAGNQRCYLGGLWTGESSFSPPEGTPLIYAMPSFMPPDIIEIGPGHSYSRGLRIPNMRPDVRTDARVKQALIENGQFHAGMDLTLDKVEISRRENGSSLKYTYTLKNSDKDNLYVLDPDKMGKALFHYFHNGPVLLPDSNDSPIGADTSKISTKPEPWDKIDTAWLTLIKSGESMMRTVTLDAYPVIAADKFVCRFRFNSPMGGVSKDIRQQPNGRIWMGSIDASLAIETKNSSEEKSSNTNPAAGIQFSIWTDKTKFYANEKPVLYCNLKTAGQNYFNIFFPDEIIIDGQRFQGHIPDTKGSSLSPQRSINLETILDEQWFRNDYSNEPLKWSAGKHTISTYVSARREHSEEGGSFRAGSNEVQIEILPEKAGIAEKVRNLFYKTNIGDIAASPALDMGIRYVSGLEKSPEVKTLCEIARNGSEAEKKELLESLVRMCNVYLNELPLYRNDANAPWQPSVMSPGGGIAVPYILSIADKDAATMDLVVRMFLRMQQPVRLSRNFANNQWVMSNNAAVFAYACDRFMGILSSRGDLQTKLSATQQEVLKKYSDYKKNFSKGWKTDEQLIAIMNYAVAFVEKNPDRRLLMRYN